MRKAVFAGAVALAMMGPLLVSEHGFGPSSAAAQDVVVTEGKIARLRSALRLTGEQIQHWRPVEAALRAAIREQREGQGLVQKVRDRVSELCRQRDGASARAVGGGSADREPRREAARKWPPCAPLDGRRLDVLSRLF